MGSGFFSSCVHLFISQELAIRFFVFFFNLVNSLGAEDLPNGEVNGERVRQGNLCMKWVLFLFLFL